MSDVSRVRRVCGREGGGDVGGREEGMWEGGHVGGRACGREGMWEGGHVGGREEGGREEGMWEGGRSVCGREGGVYVGGRVCGREGMREGGMWERGMWERGMWERGMWERGVERRESVCLGFAFLVSQSKLEEQLEKVKLEKDKVVEELHTAKTMVSTLTPPLVCSVVPRG